MLWGNTLLDKEKSMTAHTEHNKTKVNAGYDQWFVSVHMAKEILL